MNQPGKTSFSVVICSVNPWNFAQAGTCFERLLRGFPFEIIGIHDAKSLAEGYNRGLGRARGDIVIFSHDDVTVLDKQFAQKIVERMESWDILGFAGASGLVSPAWSSALNSSSAALGWWRHDKPDHLGFGFVGMLDWPVTGGIEALDGMCVIARHETATAIGFDSDTFDGWHLYDSDFSFKAYLAGYKIGVCCDIPHIHLSAGQGAKSASYKKYAEHFVRKYRHKRAMFPFEQIQWIAAQCYVNDHKTLISLWTEDIFRRAALSAARSGKEEFS
ncbi:MAG: glycosyltransferase family protein [Betaproteobacteria bacterium]|nr:glycosyltransferase family protein [Betaproteobacteria bacterium]